MCRSCSRPIPANRRWPARAQAILASSLIRYDAALLAQLPNLRIIARTGIGIDNLDLEAATAHGVVCVHTPDGTESTLNTVASCWGWPNGSSLAMPIWPPVNGANVRATR
ncbi:MAG: hypothetical protein R2911_20630 [Caldilineaceae bacterium]